MTTVTLRPSFPSAGASEPTTSARPPVLANGMISGETIAIWRACLLGRPRRATAREREAGFCFSIRLSSGDLWIFYPALSSLVLQINCRQRRQSHGERAGPAVQRDGHGLYAAKITGVAAAVIAGVAVQTLPPKPSPRRAEPVVMTRYRREIADDQDQVV